ncbi:hypothetical protein HID58_015032 [Brassica napus]|uniref:Uncharacterized protein n=2 Tax=Brassica TaxID=3705 RepID=A0ABQ8DLC1_BRANA|nr:hypothetical protein HID58_015032 [Brassica napus]
MMEIRLVHRMCSVNTILQVEVIKANRTLPLSNKPNGRPILQSRRAFDTSSHVTFGALKKIAMFRYFLDQPPCYNSWPKASLTFRQVPLEQNFLNSNQADAPSNQAEYIPAAERDGDEADVTTPTIRKHVTTAQMSSQRDEDEVSRCCHLIGLHLS